MKKAGISRVEQHLESYLRYNCNPNTDGKLPVGHSLIRLTNPYLEIEQAAFATDGYGQVWKAQAIECMKEKYGISYINDIRNYLNIIEANGLVNRDIMSEIDQKKQEFERELEQEEITETDVSTDGGYSYGQVNGWLSVLHRIGVTQLIAEDMSSQQIQAGQYISAGQKPEI